MKGPRKRSARTETAAVEPWETEFLHREMPTHSREELEKLTSDCKRELGGTKDRKKLVECARRKLA